MSSQRQYVCVRLLDGSLWEVIAPDASVADVQGIVDTHAWIACLGPLFNEDRRRTQVRSSAVVAIVPYGETV